MLREGYRIVCNIKLKVTDGDKNVELEMLDYNEDTLKYVIDKLTSVIKADSEAAKEVESSEENNPLKAWREGYQSLVSDKTGLHDPGSEYKEPAKKELAIAKKETAATASVHSIDLVKRHENKKQLWYICESGHKGKHYITPDREYVTCHTCNTKMKVRFADPRGPEYKDECGNYYIAGEYKKTLKDKEDEERFWRERNILQKV